MSGVRGGVVVAVDQGTSSTKTVAMDGSGQLVARATTPVGQANPRPGWLEQDPEEILASVLASVAEVVAEVGTDVVTVGLSNQRESALVWETASGRPLGPMLGWQDRRTVPRAQELARAGASDAIRRISGLPLDPMFSALKIEWLLDQVDPDRSLAARGAITVGTLDAWLLSRLTGERRIEAGNASRTQLLDVATASWSEELAALFRIPMAALPPIVDSDAVSRPVAESWGDLAGLSFSGVLGDSHAALFAHGVREPGLVKVTYGTGSSVMGLSAGSVAEATGMVETLGWQRAGVPARAFEGNILSVGSTLLWVADMLGCTTEELDRLARSVPDNGGVYLVPAFSGLGAPWWDEAASSVMVGFGPGNGRAHVARGAFESIPLQIEDVLERADQASGVRVATVLTDGGPTRNDWLMQMQADLSNRQVQRSDVAELSVSGAAHLAGLSVGWWSEADVAAMPRQRTQFEPAPDAGRSRAAIRGGWADALRRARVSRSA
ncbi:FGGY family carbohydrate kinase [Isoptericola sp. b441]|uniref:ATP:glycerol 3-phosphotransferase n=1 Tax=Actinotalea lenta TaxID=3064654 RepID=A0ABT9D8G5_9CELL|nr:FGGY family carbohydrate kinase [Isoptericola sp. b441]MDO8107177.1 FGGY family carbohydrate kinase [Isoptericola sp. b441]